MFSLYWHKMDSGLATEDTYRHASTARGWAAHIAQKADIAVEVHAAGKCRFVVFPDGHIEPPPNAQVDPRERHKADGPCFCTACRAGRREDRVRGQRDA